MLDNYRGVRRFNQRTYDPRRDPLRTWYGRCFPPRAHDPSRALRLLALVCLLLGVLMSLSGSRP